MLENLGGRKFVFGVILVIMGFVFTLLGKVSVEAFFTFASVVGASYIVGNVATKAVLK